MFSVGQRRLKFKDFQYDLGQSCSFSFVAFLQKISVFLKFYRSRCFTRENIIARTLVGCMFNYSQQISTFKYNTTFYQKDFAGKCVHLTDKLHLSCILTCRLLSPRYPGNAFLSMQRQNYLFPHSFNLKLRFVKCGFPTVQDTYLMEQNCLPSFTRYEKH